MNALVACLSSLAAREMMSVKNDVVTSPKGRRDVTRRMTQP